MYIGAEPPATSERMEFDKDISMAEFRRDDVPGALALLDLLERSGDLSPEIAKDWRVRLASWAVTRPARTRPATRDTDL